MTKESDSKKAYASILLLIPQEWLEELNTLAAARFLTRLGLLRFYIRQEMNKDLLDLTEHFKQRNQFKRTKSDVDKWLKEREE